MIGTLGSNSAISAGARPLQALTKSVTESPAMAQSGEQSSSIVSLTSGDRLAELRSKFNAADISNRDANLLSQALMKNGLISAFEASNLSIAIVPPGTEYNPDARRNLMQEIDNQIHFSKAYGLIQQTQSLIHVQQVLRDLQQGK